MISEEEAAGLVQTALQAGLCSVSRQALTHSGNDIFRAELPDGRWVVLRVSPRAKTFAYTQANLDVLRALGLPVQTVLAAGPTAAGGSFIILNWMAGRDLMYELAGMTPEQMTRLAKTIADYQKRVGRLPASKGFGWAPIGKNAPTAHWTEIFGTPEANPVTDAGSALDRLRGRLCLVRRSVEPHFAGVKPICFLDDLTTKNILVEKGALTGIIDIDFVCYGDPLMAVGSTLAAIAVDVGEAGRFYGEELVRWWAPTADGMRAIRFYAALWTIGILSAAEAAGDAARVEGLLPVAEGMLGCAERESGV